ncbi:ribbon-helix-helix domain-containing protein [Hyperthermus butylicus]|uniref:CopG-like ribbon-helix-helix domain-containing protein n=1 Tax=Hyperthermus butylicus (strain DSM 5456 / JCM 9403 / PLM1-5) TaxID=415426 RepID=A2BKK5_HYPBU|nr:hypothetical protein [Hyperthermus butylicus]ABM80516.1 hypothetical protein Hbut_0660 [Hyperthermus butylicus DSM 5456]
MPTIHLSLPESVYNELKEYADEMGMQITSLVKMLIREGLEKLRRERAERMRKQEEKMTQVMLQILNELEQLRRELQEFRTYTEGELYRLNSVVSKLRKRVDKLEDEVEARLIHVEEPELVP